MGPNLLCPLHGEPKPTKMMSDKPTIKMSKVALVGLLQTRNGQLQAAEATIKAQDAAIERVRGYAIHRADCNSRKGPWNKDFSSKQPCSCGFDEHLTALKQDDDS